MSACKHCGEPVWWVKTEASNKPMPLDPTPVRFGGSCIIVSAPGARTPIVRVLKRGEDPPDEILRYTTHLATCKVLHPPKPERILLPCSVADLTVWLAAQPTECDLRAAADVGKPNIYLEAHPRHAG